MVEHDTDHEGTLIVVEVGDDAGRRAPVGLWGHPVVDVERRALAPRLEVGEAKNVFSDVIRDLRSSWNLYEFHFLALVR